MRSNLSSKRVASVDFFDGYLFRILQELLREGDPVESGLGQYYASRFSKQGGGLSDYEGALAQYLLASFPKARCLVHVGIGIGTTTAFLAAAGQRIYGIDYDRKRLMLAGKVRDAVLEVWPEVADRYRLVGGTFPEVMSEIPEARGRNRVLFFTKLGGSPRGTIVERMIAALRNFEHVVMDLRTFAEVAETEAEQDALRQRIVTVTGLVDCGPIETAPGSFYRRFHAPWLAAPAARPAEASITD